MEKRTAESNSDNENNSDNSKPQEEINQSSLPGVTQYDSVEDPNTMLFTKTFKGYDSANSSAHSSPRENRSGMKTDLPPGFSLSGSRNLPIPDTAGSSQEVTSGPETHSRKRRRKKRKGGISPENTEQEMRNGTAGDVKLAEGEYLHHAFGIPEYNKPAARQLPPITTHTAAVAVTGATLLGPISPNVHNLSRPKTPPPDYMMSSKNNQSFTNTAYEGDFESGKLKHDKQADKKQKKGGTGTGFISGKSATSGKFKEEDTKETLYFNDGVRHIDFILAYEVSEDGNDEKDKIREKFEGELVKSGLQLEIEPKEESQDQKTVFVKVHIPWETRLKYAERMKMKMPLKEDKIEEEPAHDLCDLSWMKSIAASVCKPCRLKEEEVSSWIEEDCYTAEFNIDKMDFFNIIDQKTFFSDAQRSRMAMRILSEAKYGEKRIDIGITPLVNDQVYTAAYPLHVGKKAGSNRKMAKDENLRRLLYWEWARWGRWYKFQPLDLIRQYLGEKVAIYFAWLGFYTEMLIYPSVLGVIVFIYSIATLFNTATVQEVCDEAYPSYAGNITMCPLCDFECTYWKLSTSCLAARITQVFDNESTIFFAIFMSLWATMFLEFWKRRQFTLSYDWDLVDYDEDRDLIRPEFEARATGEMRNRVTGDMVPFIDPKIRFSRACMSLVAVFFWILVVIAAVFSIIVYRLVISAVFALNVDLSGLGQVSTFATPAMLTTITASLLSLIIIMLLNFFYEKVAIWLTNLELPRTQIEFEDSFTWKMFCFQFVNYYSYLFYVAFFKQTLAGYPAQYTYLFTDYRWDQCDAGGCMYELSIQLIIIMAGKQVWNNVVELVWPWLINQYRMRKSRKVSLESKENIYTRWEQDYDLVSPKPMALFYEYLEMVIQFGFATLFVAAFPLAPLLALINNIIEIRLDANKFVCELRRPLAKKCSDIGAWYYLLDFIGNLAVVTNAFTIAITSEAIPKLVYYYTYSIDTYGTSTLQKSFIYSPGYTNYSLSYFDTNDFSSISQPRQPAPFPGEGNITTCRYKDYRSPPDSSTPYQLTIQYWHVIAARLAFVIVMEHVVFFLKSLLDKLIPDRPHELKEKIKREHFLVQSMLLKAEKQKLMKQFSHDSEGEKTPFLSPGKTDQPISSNFQVVDENSSPL